MSTNINIVQEACPICGQVHTSTGCKPVLVGGPQMTNEKDRELTQDVLKELIEYNPDTGIAKWKKKSGWANKGDICDSKNNHGHIQIKIRGKHLYLHRLVWLYMYGRMPTNQIDHINGIRDDNRLCNLRECDIRGNSLNRECHRTGQLSGTTKVGNKWVAQAKNNRKSIYIGRFNTMQEAHDAYVRYLEANHG